MKGVYAIEDAKANIRGVCEYGCELREVGKTGQRANRTNTVERIGKKLVYKCCWNTLRAGKIMRRDGAERVQDNTDRRKAKQRLNM